MKSFRPFTAFAFGWLVTANFIAAPAQAQATLVLPCAPGNQDIRVFSPLLGLSSSRSAAFLVKKDVR